MKTVYIFLIIIGVAVVSYYLGVSREGMELPTSLEVVLCEENDALGCFGSGRSNYVKTNGAGLWDLVSKIDELRMGLEDTESGDFYTIIIK